MHNTCSYLMQKQHLVKCQILLHTYYNIAKKAYTGVCYSIRSLYEYQICCPQWRKVWHLTKCNLVPRTHDPLGRGTKGSGIIHLFSPQILEIRYYCARAKFFKMEDMRTEINTILMLWRKYEEFFVVLFLHNAIHSINYIHSVVTLFKEILARPTIKRLLLFKTFLQQNYCENKPKQ